MRDMLSFMKWGFHAGTVNDARSARELQAIGCRLRGTLRRPSRKIIEDVHSMKANKLDGRKQVMSTFSFRAHAARLSKGLRAFPGTNH